MFWILQEAGHWREVQQSVPGNEREAARPGPGYLPLSSRWPADKVQRSMLYDLFSSGGGPWFSESWSGYTHCALTGSRSRPCWSGYKPDQYADNFLRKIWKNIYRNWKKFCIENLKFHIFLLRPCKRTFRLQEKPPALQRAPITGTRIRYPHTHTDVDPNYSLYP